MRRPIVAANWKENKTVDEALFFVKELKNRISDVEGCDVIIAAPYIALPEISGQLADSKIMVSAQDVFYEDSGAFTSAISPSMVKPYCKYVIVGHSERRGIFFDTDEIIKKKLQAVLRHGMIPILCIGEVGSQRAAGRTHEILERQLSVLDGLDINPENLILAYEPVWAISNGDPNHRAATAKDAQEVHSFIRYKLGERYGEASQDFRVLYGGSVKPQNAEELINQPDIDGGLVGNASLDMEKFISIIRSISD